MSLGLQIWPKNCRIQASASLGDSTGAALGLKLCSGEPPPSWGQIPSGFLRSVIPFLKKGVAPAVGSRERASSPLLPAWGRVWRAGPDLSPPSEGQLIRGLLRKSKEFKTAKSHSPCFSPTPPMNHATKGEEKASAEQSNLILATGKPP